MSFLTAGCTTPTLDNTQEKRKTQLWTGRLSLHIAAEPPQSFFAAFELTGDAVEGDLILTGPLGSVLVSIHWSLGEATLHTGGQSQPFDSMEALTRHMTGTSLPIDSLFNWLRGINTAGAGWKADLSRLDQGRLVATRTEPAPVTELKLVLDQ